MPARAAGTRRRGAATREAEAGPLALTGWVLFDWSTQPFYTLVVTFLFAPYFVNGFMADPALGSTLWAYATGGGELVAAILAPVLGAIADAGLKRKPWIAGFSILLVAGLAGLWLAIPGRTDLVPLVLMAYALATIGAELATVFNNAMMPSLVTPKRLGTLSGIGWATGYVGGLVSLILVLGLLVPDHATGKTLFGLTPLLAARSRDARSRPAHRPLLGAVVPDLRPAALSVHARPPRGRTRRGAGARRAASAHPRRGRAHPRPSPHRALPARAHALCRRARRHLRLWRHLCRRRCSAGARPSLACSASCSPSPAPLVRRLAVSSTIGLGSKRVIAWTLVLFILAALAVLSVDKDHILFVLPVAPKETGGALFASTGEQVYLLFAILIGLASGPIQSSSRTLLARLAPADKRTEFFGFFSFSGKATAFAAPLTDRRRHRRHGEPAPRHRHERAVFDRRPSPVAAR